MNWETEGLERRWKESVGWEGQEVPCPMELLDDFEGKHVTVVLERLYLLGSLLQS